MIGAQTTFEPQIEDDDIPTMAGKLIKMGYRVPSNIECKAMYEPSLEHVEHVKAKQRMINLESCDLPTPEKKRGYVKQDIQYHGGQYDAGEW